LPLPLHHITQLTSAQLNAKSIIAFWEDFQHLPPSDDQQHTPILSLLLQPAKITTPPTNLLWHPYSPVNLDQIEQPEGLLQPP